MKPRWRYRVAELSGAITLKFMQIALMLLSVLHGRGVVALAEEAVEVAEIFESYLEAYFGDRLAR